MVFLAKPGNLAVILGPLPQTGRISPFFQAHVCPEFEDVMSEATEFPFSFRSVEPWQEQGHDTPHSSDMSENRFNALFSFGLRLPPCFCL